jgi:hypothetical protein
LAAMSAASFKKVLILTRLALELDRPRAPEK